MSLLRVVFYGNLIAIGWGLGFITYGFVIGGDPAGLGGLVAVLCGMLGAWATVPAPEEEDDG